MSWGGNKKTNGSQILSLHLTLFLNSYIAADNTDSKMWEEIQTLEHLKIDMTGCSKQKL